MIKMLLPNAFKWIGALLVCIGLVELVFYLWFEFRLMLPVFAVFSSFIETRFFTTFQTNVADELILISFLAGFFFMAFSKERTETDRVDHIRAKAFSRAIVANTILLLFSVLFIFGNGFIAILFVNLFSVFIFYLVFFYYLI